MNKLTNEKRAQILSVLCEGMGINAACRVTGASKMTVLKLLADAGEACAKFNDENVRNVKSKRIHNADVSGSSPLIATKQNKGLAKQLALFYFPLPLRKATVRPSLSKSSWQPMQNEGRFST